MNKQYSQSTSIDEIKLMGYTIIDVRIRNCIYLTSVLLSPFFCSTHSFYFILFYLIFTERRLCFFCLFMIIYIVYHNPRLILFNICGNIFCERILLNYAENP